VRDIVICVGIGLAIAGYPPQACDGLPKSDEGSGFIILLGTIGFLARSLVFILIGRFLIFAAWAYQCARGDRRWRRCVRNGTGLYYY
jgi:hypothetical protein